MSLPLQNDTTTLVIPPAGEIDWEAQPKSLTTRQVAVLLGKSTGNVRARASKGDFGVTAPGPDGLPRYDRERVRPIYERMAAREAQSRNSQFPAAPPEPQVSALLAAMQVQQEQQTALCLAWVEEARQAVRQAKEEAQELRILLREREETTRETLSHMDILHDQNVRQTQETLERERARWTAEIAARDAEIERLKSEPPSKKSGVSRWGK